MYYVTKQIEISGSHQLKLSYPSKCTLTHGHNWIITVHCRARKLNSDGMVVDFTDIKQMIQDKLDHKHFNDVLDFNPTAENIARYICDLVNNCYRVEVQESSGNVAAYEKDEDI